MQFDVEDYLMLTEQVGMLLRFTTHEDSGSTITTTSSAAAAVRLNEDEEGGVVAVTNRANISHCCIDLCNRGVVFWCQVQTEA